MGQGWSPHTELSARGIHSLLPGLARAVCRGGQPLFGPPRSGRGRKVGGLPTSRGPCPGRPLQVDDTLLLRMEDSGLPQQFPHGACKRQKRKVPEVTFHQPPPPRPESPHLEEWDLEEGCPLSWGSGCLFPQTCGRDLRSKAEGWTHVAPPSTSHNGLAAAGGWPLWP